MLGAPLSVVVGYFLAGWLNEFFGWRMTFMLLGLPGLGLAALAWFTLKEPRRSTSTLNAELRRATSGGYQSDVEEASAVQPSLELVCVTLWSNRTFRHLLLYFSVLYFFDYGIQQWQSAFFIRSYGLQTGELGTWLTFIFGLGGLVGIYCGGELASRRAAQNERSQLKAMAFVYAVYAILSTFIYLSPNQYLAFGFMSLAALGGALVTGPLLATMQTLVPHRMRAVALAITYLFANFIGMGLGPLAAGMLSDAIQPVAGVESLRYALLAFCPGYLWGAWHLLKASRTVLADIAAVQGTEGIQSA
jgi:predicted MFS family arabinose efflux permease